MRNDTVTINIPATRVARYDLAEIFSLINTKAQSEADVEAVLKSYKTPELLWFLQVMYTADVKWKFGTTLPRWVPSAEQKGNTYSTAFRQLDRLRSLVEGTRPDMDVKKAREVFLNAMESIHAEEAKWIGYLVKGKAAKKIKFMSKELVERTFAGLIPQG